MGMSAGLGVTALAALATSRQARADACSSCHVIDVIDCGADPTGVNDSTLAIQDAINRALDPSHPQAAPSVGAEVAVVFPNGKYRITDTLVIKGPNRMQTVGNISLIGMRASIRQDGVGKDMIRFEDTHHCMIKDLYLSATLQSGHGIALINSIRTVLENVEIYQVGGNCLYADQAFWLSAYDCIFSLPGVNKYAVRHLSGMNNISYYHCRFVGSSTALDRGGLFTASATGAISNGSSAALSIVACDFSFCKLALKLHAGANLYVANGYFEANLVGVQWGEIANALDPVTGDPASVNGGWPMCGTLDNCYFISKISGQVVFIDIKRGTNLRINNPFFDGNGASTTGIHIASATGGDLRRVVIDDVPQYQSLQNVVVDDNVLAGNPTLLKKPSVVAY